MCLIAVAWNPDETPSLVLASNRDEFYDRPSQPATYWDDKPNIYGGRDLLLRGTWLCCSTTGRFAAVTNFASPEYLEKIVYPKSRGEIPTNFVNSTLTSEEFVISELEESSKNDYGGFNALLFDGESLIYCSNRDSEGFWKKLSKGTYGLSNHLLDTPWPKVKKLKDAMTRIRGFHHDFDKLSAELLDALEDKELVNDESLLPKTYGRDLEYQLSAVFVKSPKYNYGTRTSTVVCFVPGQGFFVAEKNHQTPSFDDTVYTQVFVTKASCQ